MGAGSIPAVAPFTPYLSPTAHSNRNCDEKYRLHTVNYTLRADTFTDNMKGSGGSVLGSLLVVSRTGEVLFYHKEKVVGDQPDPEELKAAINQLGETGVAACECGGES